MTKIRRFEDLEVWREARQLTKEIYQTSSVGEFARDFQLRDQIRRSRISVMSNIAEGFERDGNREFLHFLAVAKGSCGELRSQLLVALDPGYLVPDQFQCLLEAATKLSRLRAVFMEHLRRSGFRGRKYK